MTLAPSPTASPQPHVPLITTTAAVDPTTPAAGGLIESVSLWKTLGYMSFNETAPFSFGFVRPQALTHIHPSVHGHTKPLVLALERTLGTNVSGYPLYTLVIRGGQAGAAAEHLGYLITADMSHDAVQRWLAFLQRNLNLHPHTLLLDPEDIVGHAAASLVFGHSCILLWAIDRLESRWSHEALPLIAHSASALGYSGGRSVADVVMALLAPSAEGYQQPSTMQIHASSSAPLLAAHDAAHSPMSLCFHSTSPFLAPVPAPPIAAQSPPPASAAHGDAALAKANALFHATCNA
ncbi:hypothetical protein GQ54DRAFT_150637 [Martensiomyces pterosporus]|nr:hypothetical protein GQ54DRAFT_150637 [Martensiomyces pterosporus]